MNLPKVHFMTDKNWFMPAVLFISLWQQGTNVVLFEAGFVNLITALQEMTVMQIITTNGVGPGYRAVTLVYYVYRMAFDYTATMGMGMACALSWIVALFILLVTRINFRLSKRWVCYD